ncbi:MAG: rhodanese-like domain-containing protein [Nitrososphaerota archaeon]|nr:rhodanese-like domain-containing protein [Nitrososphaerota archaeon]
MKSIGRNELASKLGSPGVVVVNVLAAGAYEKIRIRGSISIPRNELEQGRWRELDRSKEVVVHCSSYECEASRMAAKFLEEKGFDVKAYEGGIKDWVEAGLPTDGTVSAERFLAERYGKPASPAASSRADAPRQA